MSPDDVSYKVSLTSFHGGVTAPQYGRRAEKGSVENGVCPDGGMTCVRTNGWNRQRDDEYLPT